MLRLVTPLRALAARRRPACQPARGWPLSGDRPRRWRATRCGAAPAASAGAATTPAAQPPPPPPPPPSPWSLYAHPELYDALFAFNRDFSAEVDFVARALARHGTGEMKSFLDAGCGPAHHARAAAAAGAAALALDASPAMLSYARDQALKDGVTITTVLGDLTAALPPLPRPFSEGGGVDAALAALGTLAHATAPGAPAAAFKALASALRPGGVLVLELAAADDVFDGALIGGDAWDAAAGRGAVEAAAGPEAGPPPPSAPSAAVLEPTAAPAGFGTGPRRPAEAPAPPPSTPTTPPARLTVEYGTPDDPWDAVAQVLTRTVRVTEAVPLDGGRAGGGSKKKGGRPGPRHGGARAPHARTRLIGQEAVAQRVFTPQEIRLLGAGAGLEVVAEFGDMDEGVAAVGAGGDRYVAVLVKTAA